MKLIIAENDEGQRLDVYLAKSLPDISRSKVQQAVKNGEITLNGAVQKPSYLLREGDEIEFKPSILEPVRILPQDIALDVVFEDENMAVINKPSGMLTHPTINETQNTLVNALLHRFGENLSDINGDFRRGILHRLDRNTSGLLMIAKNNHAHAVLAEQIKHKTAIRRYLAVVNGIIAQDCGKIDLPIGRSPKQPHKMAVVEGGKESITEFKVLERFKSATYLELTLQTGRTRQIRVHLSHSGHPVFNDSLYGAPTGKIKTQEQVLQAYCLRFTKINSHEIIDLRLEPDKKIEKVLCYARTHLG